MSSTEVTPGSAEAKQLAEAVRHYSQVLANAKCGDETRAIREQYKALPEFSKFADSPDTLKANLLRLSRK